MPPLDRNERLRLLDQRHDELVRDLDELNARVEAVLGRAGLAGGRGSDSSAAVEVPRLVDRT